MTRFLLSLFSFIGLAFSLCVMQQHARKESSVNHRHVIAQPHLRLLASNNTNDTILINNTVTPIRTDNYYFWDEPKGTIKVDFYRTREEKTFLGTNYNSHSIPHWRIRTQTALLNAWFGRRVRFELGDIYEIDDYTDETQDCFVTLSSFRSNDEIETNERVSVLYVEGLDGNILGCGVVDVPLGTVGSVAGLVVKANDRIGATLAHEMGHILGFRHTADGGDEEVNTYTECGLNLRYPQFTNAVSDVVADRRNSNQVKDDVTGDIYQNRDWRGRSNVMSGFNPWHVLRFWQVGFFHKDYEEIFDDILECWFERSEANTASGNSDNENDNDGDTIEGDGNATTPNIPDMLE